jgi:ubiquinone/menaquinone biosynthesis C-methylase UbiE
MIMDYSPIAGDYNKTENEAKTLQLLGYPVMTQHLEPTVGKQILDYGCGTGNFCRLLHDRGAQVTGVDISEGMIDVARKTSPPGISFNRICSGDLGLFGEQSFDHVVSNFVLCAIPSRQMILKIFSEIYRVLRDDGTFILVNSNWEKSNGREFISFRLEYCEHLVSGCSIRAVTKSDPPIIFEDFFRPKAEYREMAEAAGFITVALEEPLAPDDGSRWLDERTHPPFFVIVFRKMHI